MKATVVKKILCQKINKNLARLCIYLITFATNLFFFFFANSSWNINFVHTERIEKNAAINTPIYEQP